MHIWQRQKLLARACQRLKHVVDRVVFTEDHLLFVDLHSAFKIDAVVEETHQWLHVQLVFHLITSHPGLLLDLGVIETIQVVGCAAHSVVSWVSFRDIVGEIGHVFALEG